MSSVAGCGKLVIGLPIKKCPGVRAKGSLMSMDGVVNGLELSIASIWQHKVVKVSVVNFCRPIVLYRCRFRDFTAASQSPPKWGVLGGMVTQLM